MYRFATKLVMSSAITAGLVLAAGVADAKAVKHHPLHSAKIRHYPYYAGAPVGYMRPPLTVNKRSFLDPGPVVPVGSESNYMVQNTYFVTTPDQNFARSKFGNEALPQPLEVPGRPEPIYQFSTPGYPY
jgi:hypothetical protein